MNQLYYKLGLKNKITRDKENQFIKMKSSFIKEIDGLVEPLIDWSIDPQNEKL